MGIIDAKNIFEESTAMFFITGLVGLRPMQICKKRIPGYIYVALLILAYHALYIYTRIYYVELYESMRVYSKTVEMRIIQSNINPFFLTFTMISSVVTAPKIRNLYDDVNLIDDKLKFLKARVDNEKSVRIDTSRIFEIALSTILFNLLEFFPQRGPNTTEFFDLVWIIHTLPLFVSTIALGCFTIGLTKIKRRFEAINAILPRMMIEKNLMSTLEADMNDVFRLRLVNKVHGKLVKIATDLNEAHGSVLLTTLVLYFLATGAHLRTVYLVFGQIENLVDQIVEIFWVLFYISKFTITVEACHRVAVQARLSGQLLREKWTDVDHHPLKQETDGLIAQIESRNLQLTACNFFVIDYPALKTIIVSLAAYIIFVAGTENSCDEK